VRLAAIDIGSNAARLLIQDVTMYKDGSLDYTKINLVRVPLRLGFDVFETGIISQTKINELTETMMAFKHLLNVYQVVNFRVCATSAMRDAQNASSVVVHVQQQTGLSIEVISGNEEAQILYETHLAENFDSANAYLYIDVGGGSTELTLFNKMKIVAKKSFNIGTIRLLKDKVDDEVWEDLKTFVKSNSKSIVALQAIGSGGNINKIFTISKRKNGKPLSIETLKEFYKEMNALSVTERMHRYGFREDRADVIVPALEIYTAVMRWGNIDEIMVPQIGLADGLIKLLYRGLTFTSMKGLQKK
jgi:exopolyphosphatase / guanosine-5'-triphosphate,3'-diphosphate pyrophosphatase